MPKSKPQPPLTKKRKVTITKKQFEDTLVKVFAQPVSGKPLEGDQEVNQTSVAHPFDGYSGKHKSQGKIEDKEG